MLIVMAKDFKTTAEIPVPKRLIDQIIGQEKGVEIIKKAANQKRNVLLIGEPGCLVGDERIVLGNGTITKIGELGSEHLQKLSINVRTGEGGWKKAEATVFHYYKNQPVIEIVTESGKSIKGTYNHPLRCFKGISREYLWKRLDEISVGDKVAAVASIPCRIKKPAKTNFKKLDRTYGPKFYGKLPQKVTPELAAVIGYVLGDGWIRDTSVEFLVAEPEKDILPHLMQLCKSLFEIEPKVKGRLPAERNVKMYTVSLYSKDIAHNLCFLREKRVPDLIFKSGNAVVASFLKWLFEADGTALNMGRGKRMVGLRAKDIELLRDVQMLLLRFSIHSRITFAGGNGYYLMIRRGNDIIKFARSIGFASKKKTTILKKLAADAKRFARVKGQRFEKIKKIIHHPPQDVFDIEVPKCHRFIANGLISHNTGKSMLAQAMAELLPVEKLQDILILPNIADKNNPKVLVTPAGEGKKILENEKKKSLELESMNELKPSTSMLLFISLLFTLSIVAALYLKLFSDIILAAFIIIGGIFLAILIFASAFTTGLKNMRMGGREEETTPKLLVDNLNKTIAPFVDATGAHSGALLGDVRHDPFQSGGLGTPAHLRVEAGMIHKANKGVLFIDEISTLSPKSQQELLSAMQDRKYSITGQSEMSSGAMVRTDPVPCDFLLIASGNLFDLEKMHPALRSRIRGYGYEIYLNEFIDDNALDRKKLERFVAQEVVKDGKIEHFTKEAVDEIIFEAKRRAGTKGKFTLRLRDLGGLVRAAGDIAKTEHAKIVTRDHVIEAKKLARTLEQQVADKQIIQKKEYEVFVTHGYKVGKVNGLAVMGTERGNFGGILLPIEAQVAPALSAREGKIIATGKLGEIAREAVQNVSAIIKKYKGTDISSYDTHIQFLQTYEGVEGDSASVSVATAVISALEGIPVDLSIAMTGSLSVRGEVLPVGGVSAKIEAAIEAGAKKVIVPAANREDVVLSPEKLKKIKIIPANNLCDVLSAALKPGKEKDRLIKGILKIVVC